MCSVTILADAGQLIGVLLILAGAVGYLTLYFRRTLKGDGGCGCGCGASTPPKTERKTETTPDTAPRQFVPVENLADLAARRRAEHDATERTEGREPPAA
jgi:hypothetical protein